MKKVVFLVISIVFLASMPLLGAKSAAPKSSTGTIGQVKASPLHMRRIEVDADQMSLQGNGRWWLKDYLPALLRSAAHDSGRVEVAVTGRQFNEIAASQDRIHLSGRYSKQSRRQVPMGEMIAPTDSYKITAIADISRKSRGGQLSLGGKRINLSDRKVTAKVDLIIEPISISSGLSGKTYKVSGEAARSTDRNVSVRGRGSFGSGRSSSRQIEAELFEAAASEAVNEFIRQFAPEPFIPPAS